MSEICNICWHITVFDDDDNDITCFHDSDVNDYSYSTSDI